MPVVDEYHVTGKGIDADLDAYIDFDEDSYCTAAEHPALEEFLTLDFEYFRAQCAARGWEFNLVPF